MRGSAIASPAMRCYSPSSRFFPFPLFRILMTKERLIPLIVATALFMENMDSTVIATSLPAIAADIGTSPLTLKLAITSYLLSLAVFIPASGWTADRFGARMVFSIAIGVFMIGSIGCALSQNVTHFVIARILQGMGGAMMTPVGRLVLLRSIDKSALVNAMTWVTVPGLLGIFMAMKYIDPIKSEDPERFDLYGLVLAGIGLAGIAFGLSVAGLGLLPWPVVAGLVAVGTISITLYVMHARRTGSPVLDFSLLRLSTMRASIIGGFLFRLGIGALPFLLPLLMQEGFGLTPFQSGLVTFASAVGAMGMKTLAARIIRAFGFRYMMTVNAVVSAVFLAACALFTVTTPLLLIFIIVAVGAFCVESTMFWRHATELDASMFAPAFVVVSIISAASAWFFWQMPDDAGHEISGRKAVEISSRKGAAKAAAKAASETTEDARDQRL